MSILREFKIAIGLDTKDLDKGIKKSENALMSFGKIAGGIFASFASYGALKSAVFSFTELADKVGHVSNLMGYSTENVYALGNALKRFGGNTDSAITSLNSLSNALQEARFGGGALVEVARKFGINFLKSNGELMTSEELLISLGKQMQGLDRLSKIEVGRKLGLDQATLLSIANGSDELEKLIKRQKQLGTITSQDYKIAQEFGNVWEEIKESFAGLSFMVGRFILPVIKKLSEGMVGFIDFIKKHKVVVVGFFAGLLVAMTPILVAFTQMAVASITAFAPFYAVIGVVTAIAVVAEDIYGYFKGWDTITGTLANRFPILKSVLEAIRPIVLGIEEGFNRLMTWITDPSWDSFKDIFKGWGDALKEFFITPLEYVKNLFSDVVGSVKGFLSDSFLGGMLGLNNVEVPSRNQSGVNNSYSINANVNQNITSPTPKALADATASNIIGSINSQRNMIGSN